MATVLDTNDLAAVLEMTRTRAGLSQEYMAKKCGCGQSMIAMVEKGEREPSLKMLRVYAQETESTGLIEIVGAAYIGHDPANLVEWVSESLRYKMAFNMVQA